MSKLHKGQLSIKKHKIRAYKGATLGAACHRVHPKRTLASFYTHIMVKYPDGHMERVEREA